jgi:hypothetical protein
MVIEYRQSLPSSGSRAKSTLRAARPTCAISATRSRRQAALCSTTRPTGRSNRWQRSPKAAFQMSFSSSAAANPVRSSAWASSASAPNHCTSSSAFAPVNRLVPPGSTGAFLVGTAKYSSPREHSLRPRVTSHGCSIPFWTNTRSGRRATGTCETTASKSSLRVATKMGAPTGPLSTSHPVRRVTRSYGTPASRARNDSARPTLPAPMMVTDRGGQLTAWSRREPQGSP